MRQRSLNAFFAVLFAVAAAAHAVVDNSDGRGPATGIADGFAIVILSDPPLADWPGVARSKNGKIDFNNGANGRYQAALSHARNDFKQWLKATNSPAQVLREYDTVLNGFGVKLNGASFDSLRGGPGVASVEPSLTYAPAMDVSVDVIKASAAWNAVGGVGKAGAGIKVGVIDTGIDQTHPFLTDDSLPGVDGFPKFDPGNQQFTSKKVIVARVYFTPNDGKGFTAQAIQAHGTHVSGTIAGVNGRTAPAHGSTPAINGLTGVAPKAFLGNYNVFPGNITNATSHDIAQAIDDAVKDGMDVINMSLGGGIKGFQDQLTVASNRAAHAGVVVAIAAGNSGPGINTVESPGQAADAITACASTNKHFLGVSVNVGAAKFGGAVGAFNPFTPAVSAQLANWNNTAAGTAAGAATQACTAIAAGTHAGKIVVIDRGTCTFSTKIQNAQNAGAVGVLMVNNAPGDPIAMGFDATFTTQPTIPAVMLGQSDRAAIRAAAPATASADGSVFTEFVTNNENFLASFSSRGPANLLDIKPDVCAPGVNVYSSIVGGSFAMFQGTSMATPHVAGASALLRQLHPDWTPAQVKGALVGTAVRDARLATTNPQNIGGGVINLAAASSTPAVLEPATLSFRKIEPESGQSKTISVTVTNVGSTSQTFTASTVINGTGVAASVSPASVTVAAGQSATLNVTLDAAKSAASGQYFGRLNVSNGSTTVAAPLWVAIRTFTDAGPNQ